MDIIDTIREQIESNPVILYMKGSPEQPQCGFSARTVQALMACGERFAYVDVLSNPEIRANLPAYADWPTFPQLWVKGELIGGCDIAMQMMQSGELKQVVGNTADGLETGQAIRVEAAECPDDRVDCLAAELSLTVDQHDFLSQTSGL